MFTKEQEKELRAAFWEKLVATLKGQRSASGKKINWMKYPTGMKDVFIRAEADAHGCRVCIDFQFKDAGIRSLFYDQFLETKTVFENMVEWPVNWQPEYTHAYGTTVARISVEYPNTHLFRRSDWPQMHQFLKKQFIQIDSYWTEFNELYFMLYK